MSIIPNANPFQDSPFTALSTSTLPQNAALLSNQFAWEETSEAHVLRAQVPGLNKEEVKIEVEEGRVLQVTGKRHVEKQDASDAGHHVERSSCMFKKSFTLPENAKTDQVMASLENGVLTVTVPKMHDVSKAIENSYRSHQIPFLFASQFKA